MAEKYWEPLSRLFETYDCQSRERDRLFHVTLCAYASSTRAANQMEPLNPVLCHGLLFRFEETKKGSWPCKPECIFSHISSHDFFLKPLQWGSFLTTHILRYALPSLPTGTILLKHYANRWSKDLIIYSTGKFKLVKLADAYSTGSSLMPQKKNHYSLEPFLGNSGHALC